MDYLEKYAFRPDDAEIEKELSAIMPAGGSPSPRVLKKCFSFMDLTTLNSSDTPSRVRKFVHRVTEFHEQWPDMPLPSSICVYPNLAWVVAQERLSSELRCTAVSACFPTSQSFIQVKCLECTMAVEDGADEIDIVLSLNSFLDGDRNRAYDDIVAVRSAVDAAGKGRHICLKVILETGELKDSALIAEASFLAMEAGADFIKTSTGKVGVNATPQAAYVMCRCIRRYYELTGRKVGFKPAGGISSAEDAFRYYSIVSSVLGEEWLDAKLFRFGVSRMANNLLAALSIPFTF